MGQITSMQFAVENILRFISESCICILHRCLSVSRQRYYYVAQKEKINTAKVRCLFEYLPAMDSDISFFKKILMMSCCFSFCLEKVVQYELLLSWSYVSVVVWIFVAQLSPSFGHFLWQLENLLLTRSLALLIQSNTFYSGSLVELQLLSCRFTMIVISKISLLRLWFWIYY